MILITKQKLQMIGVNNFMLISFLFLLIGCTGKSNLKENLQGTWYLIYEHKNVIDDKKYARTEFIEFVGDSLKWGPEEVPTNFGIDEEIRLTKAYSLDDGVLTFQPSDWVRFSNTLIMGDNSQLFKLIDDEGKIVATAYRAKDSKCDTIPQASSDLYYTKSVGDFRNHVIPHVITLDVGKRFGHYINDSIGYAYAEYGGTVRFQGNKLIKYELKDLVKAYLRPTRFDQVFGSQSRIPMEFGGTFIQVDDSYKVKLSSNFLIVESGISENCVFMTGLNEYRNKYGAIEQLRFDIHNTDEGQKGQLVSKKLAVLLQDGSKFEFIASNQFIPVSVNGKTKRTYMKVLSDNTGVKFLDYEEWVRTVTGL